MAGRSRSATDQTKWVWTCGLLVGAWLACMTLFAPTAAAYPAENCIQTITNVQGSNWDDGLVGAPPQETGIYSHMYFAYQSGDCVRVSSEGVISPSGAGQVEWGWVLGWHPKGPNVYTGPGYCNDRYYTNPEVFQVWTPIGGGYHCRDIRSVSTSPGGTDYSMSVYYEGIVNGSYSFATWLAGNKYDSIAVNFHYGYALTNGERHNLTIDSATTHFLTLEDQTLTHPAWQSFEWSYQFNDNDPGWDWYSYSEDHTVVFKN